MEVKEGQRGEGEKEKTNGKILGGKTKEAQRGG